MATRCRYCYSPAAGRPWMRKSVFERVRCWLLKKLRVNPQVNYYAGYNAPVYPDGWVIR